MDNTKKAFLNNLEPVTPYLGYISLILVFVSWFIVYHNAKKLATRNETKSLIDDAVKVFTQLEELTLSYWLAGRAKRMDTAEFLLLSTARLQTLSFKLEIVKRRKINISCVNFSKITILMTLNCEDVDRRKAEDNREQVQLFLEQINSTILALYSEYQSVYKPSFPLISKVMSKVRN
ncbi:hypothetical protein [Photobacterium toruni]|uniref:hypothetical protein n=1 Tax=Photobacterium toruni TaxID=1935446 RepID=UPI00210F984E|nr:hypothetical protein [Photobacterium toruni]